MSDHPPETAPGNASSNDRDRDPAASTLPPKRDDVRPGTGSETRATLRAFSDTVTELWWRFFNWLAVVSWKTLALVSLLVMIVAGIIDQPHPFLLAIVASIIIKVVAGGKRRADVLAREATQRAATEQLERTVAEARLEALQAQIEPHFLFNTLASIDQLILVDPPRASRMQQSLIRYLRSAMPRMRDRERPSLGQQLDLCRSYLEIMAVRMEERLAWKIDVADGLRSAAFPALMLQTLVENAIRHGLEPKAEGGRLEIRAEVADGRLVARVSDTGLGFKPGGANATGVGLANIRARLKAMYGDRAELVIAVPDTGGTCATITLPYELAATTA